MSDGKQRIALLIDADNASARNIEGILAALKPHGLVQVRRAYGKAENLRGWEPACDKHAIDAVPPVSSGKNATDISMVIGAMDLFRDKSVDAFALVSSDADFTPLVKRLRDADYEVYGYGRDIAPDSFVTACSAFRYVEGLQSPDGLHKELIQRICSAVDAALTESGWAHLGEVGNQLGKHAPFRVKHHGFPNLLSMIEASGLFTVEKHPHILVRSKADIAA